MIPKEELLARLKTHLTPERVQRIEEVSAQRSRKITLVLEDISQEHNIGALLRTADIMGLQDVHLISQEYEARLAKAIAKGSTKWIHLHRYQEKGADNLSHCLTELDKQGYELLVADPEGELSLVDLQYQGKPLAILMGSEWEGVSERAKSLAKHRVSIPQFGFTQSYNVSVAAALILNKLADSLRQEDFEWQLSEEERIELEMEWVMTRLGDSALPLKQKIEADWEKDNYE